MTSFAPWLDDSVQPAPSATRPAPSCWRTARRDVGSIATGGTPGIQWLFCGSMVVHDRFALSNPRFPSRPPRNNVSFDHRIIYIHPDIAGCPAGVGVPEGADNGGSSMRRTGAGKVARSRGFLSGGAVCSGTESVTRYVDEDVIVHDPVFEARDCRGGTATLVRPDGPNGLELFRQRRIPLTTDRYQQ